MREFIKNLKENEPELWEEYCKKKLEWDKKSRNKNREKILAKHKIYYEKNKDILCEKNRANIAANVEYYREYDRQWQQTEHRKQQKNESNRKCYARLKEENPEAYKEYLKKQNAKALEKLHKMKEEEPEKYAEHLRKQREAAAKRKAKKALEK